MNSGTEKSSSFAEAKAGRKPNHKGGKAKAKCMENRETDKNTGEKQKIPTGELQNDFKRLSFSTRV